jgi:hypothetical protein
MHIPPAVQLSSARAHWLTGHALACRQLASTPTCVVLLACHVSEQAASCRRQGAPRLAAGGDRELDPTPVAAAIWIVQAHQGAARRRLQRGVRGRAVRGYGHERVQQVDGGRLCRADHARQPSTAAGSR